jgi:hypothetical protein
MSEPREGPDRPAAELEELSRKRLNEGRRGLAGLQAGNAEVAPRSRAPSRPASVKRRAGRRRLAAR